jgi:hypothetical protein
MAKKKGPENLPTHPHGDTSANEGKDGNPPSTWNPGKVTQPEPELEEGEDRDQAQG